MAGLNKLHSMFENENLRHDFTIVQMEQMVSRDVRDNTLAILEHMELDDETALEAAAKNKVEDDGVDSDDDGKDDMEELTEGLDGLSDLEVEIEALEQKLMDDAEDDTKTKGPLHGMDPAVEEMLKSIPEIVSTGIYVTKSMICSEHINRFSFLLSRLMILLKL
jgi:hypothetical protein